MYMKCPIMHALKYWYIQNILFVIHVIAQNTCSKKVYINHIQVRTAENKTADDMPSSRLEKRSILNSN